MLNNGFRTEDFPPLNFNFTNYEWWYNMNMEKILNDAKRNFPIGSIVDCQGNVSIIFEHAIDGCGNLLLFLAYNKVGYDGIHKLDDFFKSYEYGKLYYPSSEQIRNSLNKLNIPNNRHSPGLMLANQCCVIKKAENWVKVNRTVKAS